MEREICKPGETPSPRPGDKAAFQRYHLGRYAEIGMALSGEDNIPRLLEMIVYEARALTNADAASLYMVNEERTHLDFVILQNETLQTFQGGARGDTVALPSVPLFVEGNQNHANVSSHVALTGKIVNIPDVYASEAFDFSGSRKYDEATGYRSRSMLVIPMRNHEHDVIGVLQLLNARSRHNGGDVVVVFSDEYVSLVAALASQAAVTLTKTRLLRDFEELFDSFIRSIAAAIEEKSRYTGGHIARVSRLALLIAQEINTTESGPFAETSLSEHELEELRLASWLHDIGKIVTPEHVVDKSTKLEAICDRLQIIEARFALIRQCLENRRLELRLAAHENGVEYNRGADMALQQDINILDSDLAFIRECNNPGEFLTDEKLGRLQDIATKTWQHEGSTHAYLLPDELENLSIRKGTLNAQERQIIEGHAALTHKMLSALPFPKHLSRVPEYASHHHEKLDGSGYPFGLTRDELSLQARIMAVADIFEALTAPDRPYKKPMSLSTAIRILGQMKEQGHIDGDVHDLLLGSGLVSIYAREELAPEQVDIPLEDVSLRKHCDMVLRRMEQLFRHSPPDGYAPRGKTVLVVDNSYINRMLLSYYLQSAPCELDFAGNALSGMEMLVENGHRCLLLALEMHTIDGFELARRIRQWERQHGLEQRNMLALAPPFLPLDEKSLEEAGFCGVIRRPYDKDSLLELLGRMIC